MSLEFLDVDDVLVIHDLSLDEFGGMAGVRDRGMLESAVAQPHASAFGDYVHGDAIAMAAAYLFHIVRNHPFVDGNKRTGLVAAIVFLDINGFALPDGASELYDLTMGVADGSLSKDVVEATLRGLARPLVQGTH